MHKRRERYSGKYPKKFALKYKELAKDTDQLEKVKNKGMTPAGTHIPIMVNEIMEVLDIQPNQFGIDATLGFGGHSLEILKRLNHTGHLYSLDIDSIEILKTKKRLFEQGFCESDLTIKHINFKDIDQVLEKDVLADFLMADLGVSSMQIDNPERGFTFKEDGPLDLRLDQATGITASELLMNLTKQEIIQMLETNSDEPYALEIANKIVENKSKGVIHSTKQLYYIIKDALIFLPKEDRQDTIKKTTQRVFQALRIDVNSEMDVLTMFLEKLPFVMKSGGKLAILTFHSGEDRLVKKAFKHYLEIGIFKEISRSVLTPSKDEVFQNPRSRSAKLRWAIVA